MRKVVQLAVLAGICVLLVAAYAGSWSAPLQADEKEARLVNVTFFAWSTNALRIAG